MEEHWAETQNRGLERINLLRKDTTLLQTTCFQRLLSEEPASKHEIGGQAKDVISIVTNGISWLINKGVPQPFVQRLAGHSSPIVTQMYTHLEDKNLATAVNAFPTLN